MTPIIYLLLGSNVVTLIGLGLMSRKIRVIEGGLRMTGRVMASIGSDFLKAQGRQDINMGSQLLTWANQDNNIHAPGCNCKHH